MAKRPALAPVGRSGAHCHRMVAETAKEFARELYGTVMENNFVYAQWRKDHPDLSDKALEDEFVRVNWGKCIEGARATLALMLRGPLDSPLKEQISEALILDATLKRGRQNGARILKG